MSTTPEQAAAISEMIDELRNYPIVAGALVNNSGKLGKFTVMIVATERKRGTTNILKSLVRKHLPAGADVRQYSSPASEGLSKERRMWKFDIVFMQHDPASSSFS